jgi:hypothetical protein
MYTLNVDMHVWAHMCVYPDAWSRVVKFLGSVI